jgi:hypothetical protein
MAYKTRMIIVGTYPMIGDVYPKFADAVTKLADAAAQTTPAIITKNGAEKPPIPCMRTDMRKMTRVPNIARRKFNITVTSMTEPFFYAI